MTSHPAITISRSLGSGGTEAGFLAARQLGWHFCDRRILRLAAGAMGRSVPSMARQENQGNGFKEWLLAILALGSPETPFMPLLDVPVYSRDLFEAQSAVMRQLVARAPSVLVGRGGFIAFKDRPGTLHVSIHADLEFRVESLVARGKAASAAAAREAIDASDRGRFGFIKAISGEDWKDPRHFGLVLDSGRLGFDGCAARIVETAQERLSLPPLLEHVE